MSRRDGGRGLAPPSVKQRLVALRHLFDWLVVGQVVPINAAHTVRAPRHVMTVTLPQANACAMIRWRTASAGHRREARQPKIQGDAITAYLQDRSTLEKGRGGATRN
jgi:site-specific recombinase XerC